MNKFVSYHQNPWKYNRVIATITLANIIYAIEKKFKHRKTKTIN